MAKLDSIGLTVRIGPRVFGVAGADLDQMMVLAQVFRREAEPHWQCVLSVSAHSMETDKARFWHSSSSASDELEVTFTDHVAERVEPLSKGGPGNGLWEFGARGLVVATGLEGIATAVTASTGVVSALLFLSKWRDIDNNSKPGCSALLRVWRGGTKTHELERVLAGGESVTLGFTSLTRDWPATL